MQAAKKITSQSDRARYVRIKENKIGKVLKLMFRKQVRNQIGHRLRLRSLGLYKSDKL